MPADWDVSESSATLRAAGLYRACPEPLSISGSSAGIAVWTESEADGLCKVCCCTSKHGVSRTKVGHRCEVGTGLDFSASLGFPWLLDLQRLSAMKFHFWCVGQISFSCCLRFHPGQSKESFAFSFSTVTQLAKPFLRGYEWLYVSWFLFPVCGLPRKCHK